MHTKGEWLYRKNKDMKVFDDYVINVSGYRHPIAHVFDGIGADAIANARLIAAAPDLLTACKNAILLIIGERIKNDNLKPDSIIEEHLEVLLCKSENELKEAINKAEGK